MRIVVTGSTGFVGSAAVACLGARGHEVIAVARTGPLAVDLAEAHAPDLLVDRLRPDALLNLGAVSDIGPCAADPALAERVNALAPSRLARHCARAGVRLLHVSTDQVFDGSHGGWREDDEARPLHVYGETKRLGERLVASECPAAIVVRPALVTGPAPRGRRSATSSLLAALERAARGRGPPPAMFTDEIRSPVAVADLARALAELLERSDSAGQLLHCGGDEVLSRHALAVREAEAAGFDPGLVGAATRAQAGLAAQRPADLSLDSSRLVALLGWRPRSLA